MCTGRFHRSADGRTGRNGQNPLHRTIVLTRVVRVLLEQVDLVTGERAAALIQVLYSGGHLSHPPDC